MHGDFKYVVWGNPISHSLSPRVHSLFAQQFGFAIDYKVAGEGLSEEEFCKAFHDFFSLDGGKGCNVTSPFKNVVYNYIENRSEFCELARACNTVVLQEDGTLQAHNTDGYGLRKDLERLGWFSPKSRVLILGAGGAVTGVLFNLLQEGLIIDVYNRTYAKAQDIVKRFSKYGEIQAIKEYNIAHYDLVINAVPYNHETNDKVNLRTAIIENHATKFYDMQYRKTGNTLFMSHLLSLGANPLNIADGLGMLVYQAAASFNLWFGQKPDAALVLEQLRAELRAQA